MLERLETTGFMGTVSVQKLIYNNPAEVSKHLRWKQMPELAGSKVSQKKQVRKEITIESSVVLDVDLGCRL